MSHCKIQPQQPLLSTSEILTLEGLLPRSKIYRPRNSPLKGYHCPYPGCTKSFYEKGHMDRHQRLKHGCLYHQRQHRDTMTTFPEIPSMASTSGSGDQEANNSSPGTSGTMHNPQDNDDQQDDLGNLWPSTNALNGKETACQLLQSIGLCPIWP